MMYFHIKIFFIYFCSLSDVKKQQQDHGTITHDCTESHQGHPDDYDLQFHKAGKYLYFPVRTGSKKSKIPPHQRKVSNYFSTDRLQENAIPLYIQALLLYNPILLEKLDSAQC